MPAHILLAALLATPTVAPPPKEPAVYATIKVEEKHFASAVHFSPDGKTLAFVEGVVGFGNRIVLWDVAKKGRTAAFEAKRSYCEMAWTPDGKAIYAADIGSVYRIDVSTGERAKLYGHDTAVTALKYMPESNRLVSAADDGGVVAWDAAKDKVLKRLKCPEGDVSWEKYLEVPPGKYKLPVLAVDAQLVPGTNKVAVAASASTFEFDGKQRLTTPHKVLYLVDLTDGTFATAVDGLPVNDDCRQLAAPHAGSEYAFADPDKKCVTITDAGTGKSRTVKGCPFHPLACRFSPSDRYLFVGGCEVDRERGNAIGMIAVCDLATEEWVGWAATKGERVGYLSYSTATNLLTCTSGARADRQITVWDMKGIIDPAAKPKKKD